MNTIFLVSRFYFLALIFVLCTSCTSFQAIFDSDLREQMFIEACTKNFSNLPDFVAFIRAFPGQVVTIANDRPTADSEDGFYIGKAVTDYKDRIIIVESELQMLLRAQDVSTKYRFLFEVQIQLFKEFCASNGLEVKRFKPGFEWPFFKKAGLSERNLTSYSAPMFGGENATYIGFRDGRPEIALTFVNYNLKMIGGGRGMAFSNAIFVPKALIEYSFDRMDNSFFDEKISPDTF